MTTKPPRSKSQKLFLTFVYLRRRYLSPGVTLIIMAAITGILAGCGAWFLKFSIGHVSKYILSFLDINGINWFLIMMPLIGILLVGMYQRYVIHFDLEHGTARLSKDLAEHRYRLRVQQCYRPIIGAVITLSMGGSAGAEGPIASAGAAIGSNVGRLFGVAPEMLRTMIGCGAGAGIAGIFKAPVGGALFSLEVLKVPLRTLSVLALVVASVCGGMTCYALTGFSFDVIFLPKALFSPEKFAWVTALGVFCGLYSVYYNRITAMLHRFFGSFKNPWLKNISGGLMVGLCLLCFPSLYGEGYNVVTELVNGNFTDFAHGSIFGSQHADIMTLALLGLAVLLLKVFATIASNSSGGVAGDFAPTIFAGAFAGMVFAMTVNHFFDANLPVALYALYGTAGAFAGIIHAPLMAMFLVAEMVGNGYGYFYPLMITASVSYIVVKLLTPRSKYANANHDDLDALMAKKS